MNNTTGYDNTANGFDALYFNTTGNNNTANGYEALYSNTTGYENTANGTNALVFQHHRLLTTRPTVLRRSITTPPATTTRPTALMRSYSTQPAFSTRPTVLKRCAVNNTTGFENTATGVNALYSNTTGADNTANGVRALSNNSTGNSNTADGVNALLSNTTGFENTANGVGALQQNTTGNFNTANGDFALTSNTTGGDNTATGDSALGRNTTGGDNTATGDSALGRNTTGSSNIGLGVSAGNNLTTGSNNIDIGNAGVASDAKKIRIGTRGMHTNTYIAGINGVTVAGGVGVIVDNNGHLGTVVSSARFKDEIKPMDKASEAILALQPVTFRYKHELDPEGIPQFGLVAEEVEKVNPALVARDEQGRSYTVRYEAVNAMLLNEFLKEHKGRRARSNDRTSKINCGKAGSNHRATTKGLPGDHRAGAKGN